MLSHGMFSLAPFLSAFEMVLLLLPPRRLCSCLFWSNLLWSRLLGCRLLWSRLLGRRRLMFRSSLLRGLFLRSCRLVVYGFWDELAEKALSRHMVKALLRHVVLGHHRAEWVS